MTEWPSKVETVLLDAGGVLLDLDYSYLRRLLEPRGIDIEEESLSRAEAQARTEIHRRVSEGGRVSGSWRDYFHLILARVGVPGEEQSPVIDSLWEAHDRVGLWTVAIPGSREAVVALKERGYRLGVVSNAEGSVARDLDSAGYQGLFETVVDSHLVGVEKPDPAIFAIALERLGVEASGAVYCGDVPSVDVAGADAAGIAPVLLDRHDLYADVSSPRMRSLSELAGLLTNDS